MEKTEIVTIAINGLLLIITILILYIHISNKYFHLYPCYIKLIICISIFFNNALYLIKLREINSKLDKIICYSKGFFLSFFDKLILFTLIINTLILYLGILRRQYYSRNQKKIFHTLILVSIIISFGLSIFHIVKDTPTKNKNCLIPDKDLNVYIDFSFASFLLCIDVFCILKILLYLLDKKREITSNSSTNKKDYNHHFNIILLMLLIDGAYFILILLRIHKTLSLNEEYFNLLYLGICLIVYFFYAINKNVFGEIVRIVLCKKNNNELLERDLSSFSGTIEDSRDDDSSFNL